MSEKLPAWSEGSIQVLLATEFSRTGSICVPNCGAFAWEADLLRINRNLTCVEYEIKISRADFRADKAKVAKHIAIESRPTAAPETCPNYFWYAAPQGVVPVDELPAYAGLIEVIGGRLVVARKAKRLHGSTIHTRYVTYACRGIAIRFWQQRHNELKLKDKQKELSGQVENLVAR